MTSVGKYKLVRAGLCPLGFLALSCTGEARVGFRAELLGSNVLVIRGVETLPLTVMVLCAPFKVIRDRDSCVPPCMSAWAVFSQYCCHRLLGVVAHVEIDPANFQHSLSCWCHLAVVHIYWELWVPWGSFTKRRWGHKDVSLVQILKFERHVIPVFLSYCHGSD